MNELIKQLAQQMPPYIPGQNFIPGVSQVPYSGPYWNHRELEMAMQSLLTGKWMPAGEYVARFQNIFAQQFKVKHAHMVNSGSSANLAMVAAVKERLGWADGSEVIVSPVGFPTTIAPLVQCGLKPAFVDIEMETLNFDVNLIEAMITKNTRAIFVSPVLGNPPDMDKLLSLSAKYGLTLLGDNCDSLGSKWGGVLLNKYYYAWTTSLYVAHHISTGEGGMVCSDDGDLIKLARSFSWWGKDCYCVGQANALPNGTCGERFKKWLPDVDLVLDHKYVFTNMGYNLKPLDLQGAIGIAQMEKWEEIESKRRNHAASIASFFEGKRSVKVVKALPKADPCWFGVPLLCETQMEKEDLQAYFEFNHIQTRSYFAGNILRHPGYRNLGTADNFPLSDESTKRVFFIGCAPHLTEPMLDYIENIIKEGVL